MSKTEDLLLEMQDILDELLENAEQLIEVSKGAIEEEELQELQDNQEELIQYLLDVDEELSKVRKQAASAPRGDTWTEIEEKLQRFQELNQTFIQNMSVRQGLVRFELKDIKKVRQSIKEMRSGYGSHKAHAKAGPRGKPKVDHIS